MAIRDECINYGETLKTITSGEMKLCTRCLVGQMDGEECPNDCPFYEAYDIDDQLIG